MPKLLGSVSNIIDSLAVAAPVSDIMHRDAARTD